MPLEPAIKRVRMVLHALGAEASPLRFELRGPGYRGTGRFAGYTPGTRVPVAADVTPSPPKAVDGTLCLRNTGRRSVGLVGTDEGFSASLPGTSVDGTSAGAVDPALAFLDGPPRSLLSQAGTVLGRASDFTGGVVPLWLLWPLTVLLVLAAPVAVALELRCHRATRLGMMQAMSRLNSLPRSRAPRHGRLQVDAARVPHAQPAGDGAARVAHDGADRLFVPGRHERAAEVYAGRLRAHPAPDRPGVAPQRARRVLRLRDRPEGALLHAVVLLGRPAPARATSRSSSGSTR